MATMENLMLTEVFEKFFNHQGNIKVFAIVLGGKLFPNANHRGS